MEERIVGDLSIIAMRGCEEFAAQMDEYLREWHSREAEESYIAHTSCPRFGWRYRVQRGIGL